MDIRLGVVAILLGTGSMASAGCGLRSDPLIPDGLLPDDDAAATDDGDAVDPDRIGSCNDPIALAFTDARVTGTLARGGSLSEAWCGADGGPEDQYSLVVDFDTDVTIDLDDADFAAVLRVEQGGCGGSGTLLVCDRGINDEPFHFLAQAGVPYTITIDTKDGEDGDYAFDIRFGAPPIGECPVHPESIEQVPGATFVWENMFSSGQGRVDGYCGGPGRENMFTLNAYYSGFMYVSVTGSGGLQPVASLRTGCGATSELICARDGDTGVVGVAEFETFIEGPGTYYVIVDQGTIDGGDYALRVDME